MKEINGWAYTIDSNIGPVSTTMIMDNNGLNGLGLSVGPGIGISTAAVCTHSYTLREMHDDIMRITKLVNSKWKYIVNKSVKKYE